MPPLANRNAVRHGLRSGSLPQGAGYIRRITDEFRRAVEERLLASKGEVTLMDAATIQTAVRWERHSLLAQRWLRRECEELSPDQKLAFSREVARGSAERDKCLRSLKLERDPNAWIAELYRQPFDDVQESADLDTDSPGDTRPAPESTSETSGEPAALEREFGDEDDA